MASATGEGEGASDLLSQPLRALRLLAIVDFCLATLFLWKRWFLAALSNLDKMSAKIASAPTLS